MRTLIAIPAYNEEPTIGGVIERTREVLPTHDIVVLNDGSRDRTAQIVRSSQAYLLNLPCNLGYSSAIETLLRFAWERGYDAISFIDADGQHDPHALPAFLEVFERCQCDVLIGSRYISARGYDDVPFGRRLGMLLFSHATKVLTGKRIFDTTSGMKAINRRGIQTLLDWQFVDFHAEAIIYLLWFGIKIEEYPITVEKRQYGESMYSLISHVWYPLSVMLMIVISLIHLTFNVKRRKGAV